MLIRLFGMLIAKLFAPLSSFLLAALIARTWGKETLGEYNTVLVWFTIFQFISVFGASEYISKEIGREPSTAQKYFVHGFFFALLSSIVCLCLMGGGSLLFNYPGELKYGILTMSLALPFVSTTMICQSVLTSFQKIKYIALASVLEGALVVLVGIFVIYRQMGLIVLIGSLVVIRLLSAVLNLSLLHNYIERLRYRFQPDWKFLRRLVASLAVFGVTGAAGQLFMRVDIVILSLMKDMGDVGLYSSASKLWELCLMLPLTFYIVNLPVAAQGYQKARSTVQQQIESYARNLFVPVFLLFGCVFFFADSVLLFIYGPSFTSALWLLRIFMLAFLIQSADIVLGMMCQAAGYHKAAMNIAIFRAGVNIVLNIVLIPILGLLGAALSTLVAIFLSFIIFQIFVKRTLHQFRWSIVAARPAVICILMMLLLLPLRNVMNTVALGFLFVLGYGVMILQPNGFRLKVDALPHE